MGWSSGSRLMRELIFAFDRTINDGKCEIPEYAVIQFWRTVISKFEDDDWDTQTECLGDSQLWDQAYFADHPYDQGYFAQEIGAINPHPEGTQNAEKWQEGYSDWLDEQEDSGDA